METAKKIINCLNKSNACYRYFSKRVVNNWNKVMEEAGAQGQLRNSDIFWKS